MLRGRLVIGGIKYWAVMCLLMLGISLILLLAPAGTMVTPPFFAYITGVTVMRHVVSGKLRT
jgi:hypothetical protein